VLSTGVFLLLPNLDTPARAAFYLTTLLILDVAIFALFGHVLITKRVLEPIDKLVAGAEAIATGELVVNLPEAETREMARLSEALDDMARRLISDQEQLAANIQSLDETNRQLTEARDAMVQAEKLASAGRLGSGIAHEVGNPLGAIIGYLSLLKKNGSEKQLELITAAEREAHRIDRIVRGLLDYSRPHEAKRQSLDINRIIRNTVDLVATQGKFKRINLEVALAEDVPSIKGDPYQLEQVLVNLFVNAADALEETRNPVVVVTTIARVRQAAAPLQARRKDDHPAINYSHRRRLHAPVRSILKEPGEPGSRVVEISVSDNGPGIPRELLDQVFEPFVTTKEVGKGTGLGLAVCARLIEGMGGIIRADARDDGATFRIVLPMATNEAAQTTA
jgi:two-component system, NtrC family, sensor kinase